MKIKCGTFEFRNYLHFFQESGRTPFKAYFNLQIERDPSLYMKLKAMNSVMYRKGAESPDLYSMYLEGKNDITIDLNLAIFTKELALKKIVTTESKLQQIGKENIQMISKSVQNQSKIRKQSHSLILESFLRTKLFGFLDKSSQK